MPSTSAKQAKFMRAVSHSPKFAKKVGVPQSVGKDFEMADKKKGKFGDGGRATQYPVRIDLEKAKRDTAARDAAKRTPKEDAEKRSMEKKYPFIKYEAKGGKVMKKKAMGGKAYAKGGSVSSRADGCAKKGRTHTTMVAMAKGGKMKKGSC